jgi:hypothetical protein
MQLQHSVTRPRTPQCSAATSTPPARRRIFGCALAIAGALLLTGCSRPPAEERLRATIHAMADAVEARSASGFLDGVADDFTGNDGDLDRRRLGAMLRLEFLRHGTINVGLGAIDIALAGGDRATARFTVSLAGGSRWLPRGGARYAIDSGWKDDGANWRCISARWKRVD